jgi:hypothetical protein
MNAAILNILDGAATRNLNRVRAIIQSAKQIQNWFYVEYGPGQFVTSHIDCVEVGPSGMHDIATIGIAIGGDYEGGEFIIETSADQALEAREGQNPRGVDCTSEAFRHCQRTSWLCRPRAGGALVWGGNLTHSTNPVRSGRAQKFLARILG